MCENLMDRVATKAVEVELQTNDILHVNIDGICALRIRCQTGTAIALRNVRDEEEIITTIFKR